MPKTGGLLTPRPKEQWEQAKTLYLDGKPWKDIAAVTGIHVDVLRQKASTHKWTAVRARNKAEAKLESLRPHLHKHLHELTGSVKTPKTSNAKKLKEVADLVLTLAQTTKLVEGWREEEAQTLVNVLQISNSITANPPKPSTSHAIVDVESSPTDLSILNPSTDSAEPTG